MEQRSKERKDLSPFPREGFSTTFVSIQPPWRVPRPRHIIYEQKRVGSRADRTRNRIELLIGERILIGERAILGNATIRERILLWESARVLHLRYKDLHEISTRDKELFCFLLPCCELSGIISRCTFFFRFNFVVIEIFFSRMF